MRSKLLGATFLAIAAVTMGCGEAEVITVCYDNQDNWCEEVGSWLGSCGTR